MIGRPREIQRGAAGDTGREVRRIQRRAGRGRDDGDGAVHRQLVRPREARAEAVGDGERAAVEHRLAEELERVARHERRAFIRDDHKAGAEVRQPATHDAVVVGGRSGFVDLDGKVAREVQVVTDGQRADARAGGECSRHIHINRPVDGAGAAQRAAGVGHRAGGDAAVDEEGAVVDGRQPRVGVFGGQGELARAALDDAGRARAVGDDAADDGVARTAHGEVTRPGFHCHRDAVTGRAVEGQRARITLDEVKAATHSDGKRAGKRVAAAEVLDGVRVHVAAGEVKLVGDGDAAEQFDPSRSGVAAAVVFDVAAARRVRIREADGGGFLRARIEEEAGEVVAAGERDDARAFDGDGESAGDVAGDG